MKRDSCVVLTLLLIFSIFAVNCPNPSSKEEINLWPEIEPFRTGYLKVSEIHEIYYELCGNPQGRPVFVLHGGPGAGCSPYYRRFFNPEKLLIVLHDQRGAGKSKPFAEIRENTTQYLVKDIEKLRKHLKVKKIILFGGSWGTTLSLAYAETYPQNVSGMVLRGVFTATREEIDHFYHGGVSTFFPETYETLIATLPEPDERPLPNTLFKLIQSDDLYQREKYSKAWAKYEAKISGLEVSDEQVENMVESDEWTNFVTTLALFENYYMANGCFLKEGQLLRNTDRIRDIPVIMVNGRYDVICPPINANRLHQKLPKSRLTIVESAGHWMGEKPIEKALLRTMREFE